MAIEKAVKVMVIGGGGREHAICWKLVQSPLLQKLYCAPGNGGTARLEKTENVALRVNDFAGIAAFAIANEVDLVVIGPDNPLAEGIVDQLEKNGLRVFGPKQRAALLESSKAYAKEFMVKHGIPTAKHVCLDSIEAAEEFVRRNEWARVVKVDGLALGKGVFVCESETEARDALQIIFRENRFGDSGKRVVLEERLQGEEMSLLMFCDGKSLALMPASQDHKRRFDNDRGPNTGGMGVYAPVDLWSQTKDIIESEVLEPLRNALKSGSLNYKGVLYAGLLISKNQAKSAQKYKIYVLEFNARFGDPETQAILPLMKSDILPVLWSCTDGSLAQTEISWSKQSACCVIACAESYPEGSSSGEEISIKEGLENTLVFHSGTRLDGARLLSAGGRVLGVTALGENLNQAIDRAYKGIDSISFKDMSYRKDIGRRTLSGCP